MATLDNIMAPQPCRLCLNPKVEGIDIYNHSYPEDERQTIITSLEKIFSFTIIPTERLRYICKACALLLKELSDFFNLVMASQIFLSKYSNDYKGTYNYNSPVEIQKEYLINVVQDDSASQHLDIVADSFNLEVKQELSNELKSSVLDEDALQYVEDNKDFKIEPEFYGSACFDSDQLAIESIAHENIDVCKEEFKRKSNTFIPKAHNSNSSNEKHLTNEDGESSEFYGSVCFDSDQLIIESIAHENIDVPKKESKRKSKTFIPKAHNSNSSKVKHLTNEDGESIDKLELQEQGERKKEKLILPKKLSKNSNLKTKPPLLEDMIRKFYKINCELCSDNPVFEQLSDMFEHYDTKHKTKGFIACCGKKCFSRRSIRSHMLQHMDNNAFRCSICKKDLFQRSALKTHLLNHLPETDRPFKCSQCERRFSYSAAMKIHEESHLPVEQRRTYKCKYCDKSFRSGASRHNHMTTHTGEKYLCSECGRGFPNKTSLTLHMQIHDKSGDSDVQCKQCGIVLKNQQSLKGHMKKHNKKHIQCTLCDYTTYRIAQINHHMLLKHTDTKPYECNLCGAKFKLKIFLSRHMPQHTGEKKYSCPYCPKTFASSANYYTHRKRMHLELYTRDAGKKQEQRLENLNLRQQKAERVSNIEDQVDIEDQKDVQESVQEEIKKLESKTECIQPKLSVEKFTE